MVSVLAVARYSDEEWYMPRSSPDDEKSNDRMREHDRGKAYAKDEQNVECRRQTGLYCGDRDV